MELNGKILDNLKCSICSGYLSSAPVLLTAGGESVCGRCPAPEEEPTARNQPYELLAQHVTFPCKYEEEGCPRKFPFGQLKPHEDGCGYRKYVCPILSAKTCEWLGPRSQLMQHCKVAHPYQVAENPITFRHDITQNSVHSYIMAVYNVLFLIHTKVCTTTRKLYHSVRYTGNPSNATCYKFHVDIERGGCKFTHKGNLAPQGCLYIKETDALHTNINSLLGMLDGYDGTTFKLTVDQLSKIVECVKCGVSLKSPAFRDEDGWRCKTCGPDKVMCENTNNAPNCSYTDIANKARKHEYWYCKHSKEKCDTCNKLLSGSRAMHWVNEHHERARRTGIAWSLTRAKDKVDRYVTCDVGVIICRCWLQTSELTLQLFSPLSSEQLSMYDCLLVLSHPGTGKGLRFTLSPRYDRLWDWEVVVNADAYIQDDQTNIKIDVIKRSQRT